MRDCEPARARLVVTLAEKDRAVTERDAACTDLATSETTHRYLETQFEDALRRIAELENPPVEP